MLRVGRESCWNRDLVIGYIAVRLVNPDYHASMETGLWPLNNGH